MAFKITRNARKQSRLIVSYGYKVTENALVADFVGGLETWPKAFSFASASLEKTVDRELSVE